MKIVISGGTGLIGRALIRRWLRDRHKLVVLTRHKAAAELGSQVQFSDWDPSHQKINLKDLEGADIFVNLAGANLADRRWTTDYKKQIISSRISSTKLMVKAMSQLSQKPSVFVSVSGAGYYGSTDQICDESTPPQFLTNVHRNSNKQNSSSPENYYGADFLVKVCQLWESEAYCAERLGIRVCIPRIGFVLSPNGGGLSKMLPPFKMGVGGPMGSGQQWMSWVHIWDLVEMFNWIIKPHDKSIADSTDSQGQANSDSAGSRTLTAGSHLSGPINFTAPDPVTNKEFCQTLGKILNRPALIRTPEFALKIALGEMSQLVTTGQKVIPKKILESGFKFSFPNLESALRNLLVADEELKIQRQL